MFNGVYLVYASNYNHKHMLLIVLSIARHATIKHSCVLLALDISKPNTDMNMAGLIVFYISRHKIVKHLWVSLVV